MASSATSAATLATAATTASAAATAAATTVGTIGTVGALTGNFSLASGLTEIAALTALLGSTTAEALILGNNGAAGLPWAFMSNFGAFSILKSCLAAATPDWLRDTVGVRTKPVDSSLGLGVNLDRESVSRRLRMGRVVGLLCERSDDGPSGTVRKAMHDFDTITSHIVATSSETTGLDALQTHIFRDDPYFDKQLSHIMRMDLILLACCMVKTVEIFTLSYAGAGWFSAVSCGGWACAMICALVLHITGKSRTSDAHLDIISGNLPTPLHPGVDCRVLLGVPKNVRLSRAWQIVWGFLGLVCLANVIGSYILLSRLPNKIGYIWMGFQFGWLLLRSLAYYVGDGTESLYQHPSIKRLSWKTTPPAAKDRVRELLFALSTYQMQTHPRGMFCYTGDLNNFTAFRALQASNYRFNPTIEAQTCYTGALDGSTVTISIAAVMGDTMLSSASWLSGAQLNGYDMYDSCLVVFEDKANGSLSFVPAARVASQKPQPTDTEKHAIDEKFPPRGGSSSEDGVEWWYWVPTAAGTWLQISGRAAGVCGTRQAEVLTDKQVTAKLISGDLFISLQTVQEIRDVVKNAAAASEVLLALPSCTFPSVCWEELRPEVLQGRVTRLQRMGALTILARTLPDQCQPLDVAPAVQPDPDIGGIGVIASFLTSAYASFVLVLFAYVRGLVPGRLLTIADRSFYRVKPRDSPAWTEAVELVVLVISDQQIVTGVAMLLTGFVKLRTITIYHWHIVVYAAWVSSNVHLTTLTILRFYLQERSLLRTIRLGGMMVLLLLLLAALFPLVNADWNIITYDYCGVNCPLGEGNCCLTTYFPSTPVYCIWLTVSDWRDNVNPDTILSYIILMFSYAWKAGLLYSTGEAKFRYYVRTLPERKLEVSIRKRVQSLRSRSMSLVNDVKIRFLLAVYTVWLALNDYGESFAASLLVLIFGLLWGHIKITTVREASPEVSATEDVWGFGQIMPLLLLMLPVLAVVESYVNAHNKGHHDAVAPPVGFVGFRRGAIFHSRSRRSSRDDDNGGPMQRATSKASAVSRAYSPTRGQPPRYRSSEDVINMPAIPSASSAAYSKDNTAEPEAVLRRGMAVDCSVEDNELSESELQGKASMVAILNAISNFVPPPPETPSAFNSPNPTFGLDQPNAGFPSTPHNYAHHHVLITRSGLYKLIMGWTTLGACALVVIFLVLASSGYDNQNWLYSLIVLGGHILFILVVLLWSVLPYAWTICISRIAQSVWQALFGWSTMSTQDLIRRVTTLAESIKATTQLITRLSKLSPDTHPASPEDTSTPEEVRADVTADIQESLKQQEEELELLKQDVEDAAPPPNNMRSLGRALSQRESERDRAAARLAAATARTEEDLKTARARFRRAQLQAKRNADQAAQRERATYIASLQAAAVQATSSPDEQDEPSHAAMSSSLFAGRRVGGPRKDAKATQDDMLLSATSDVTASLRRTHALLASEVSRSRFAQETLDKSNEALTELNERYGSLDTMLSQSRGLLNTLLRSNKSDTWYLETAYMVLAATLGWLIFRRFLYGPMWWLVWLPIRTALSSVLWIMGAAIGLVPKSAQTTGATTSLRVMPSATVSGSATSEHVHGKGAYVPGGADGTGAKVAASEAGSLSESIGTMVESIATEAMAAMGTQPPQAQAGNSGNSQQQGAAQQQQQQQHAQRGDGQALRERNEAAEPRNPKKRMMEEPPAAGQGGQQQQQQQQPRDELSVDMMQVGLRFRPAGGCMEAHYRSASCASVQCLLLPALPSPERVAPSPGLGDSSDPLTPDYYSSASTAHNSPAHSPTAITDTATAAAAADSAREAARTASLDALVGRKPARQDTPRRPAATSASRRPSATEPAMSSDAAVDVGDTVEVPGGMTGVVKYVGPVRGKQGTFAGVELSREYAMRGKNDGDVDGARYFTTSVPGAGIFLPSHRASKLASPTLSSSSFPPTPTTPSFSNFQLDKHSNHSNNHTPPTPSLPKFSQSVGPGSRPNFSKTIGHGARASSPQSKLRPRPSLPRPGSPARTPSAQPTTAGRTSNVGFGASVRNGSRAMTASPAPSKFAPAKPRTPAPVRSPSRSTSQLSNRSPGERASAAHTNRFGNSVRGQSTSTVASRPRGESQDQGQSAAEQAAAAEESDRLQRNLEERDRQLREQAASLAEMESSLAELQSLMAESKTLDRGGRGGGSMGSAEDMHADTVQLRALLREKNEKISMLTAEFDGHRADFRSTIDTLEMASSETERVYEKRVQELLQEVQDLQDRGDDVESFARQLKQLEDFVAELEEGLEDARRGEAEARSEVEFLRGEVERGRSELRREREKAAKALKGASSSVGGGGDGKGSKEVEARDDEIRGLKAIIHSLSSGPDIGTPQPDRTKNGILPDTQAMEDELKKLKEQLSNVEREKGELQGLVERKTFREEELEREVTRLRDSERASTSTASRPQSTAKSFRSAHEHSDSITSTQTAIRPTSLSRDSGPSPQNSAPALPSFPSGTDRPKSGTSPLTNGTSMSSLASSEADTARAASPGLGEKDEFHEVSETASNADASAAVCDFCEQKGHDVLSCPNVNSSLPSSSHGKTQSKDDVPRPAPLRSASSSQPPNTATPKEAKKEEASEKKEDIRVPELGGDGPVAGKESGVIDMSKWCAMCEKDGHESVDCPFEDF
ncbi:hypothetical protein FH972_025814 [Carpinus fangiana]|uniref:CAP-Gly domain-containing protein n=1 Tax=Carpinus fangiana TaxID=176857 RepID=A0A5N6L2D5_9ROSI|nr:hypothetical protein FH972_025814 [Carpinus fangiana]